MTTPPHTGLHAAAVGTQLRDPWLDTARLLAALLIVAWHMSVHIVEYAPAIDIFYYATWPMRVPLYALVAGYFSSAAPLTPKRSVQLLRNILFVYLIFDVFHRLHRWWWWGGEFDSDLAEPQYGLWFLLSLFCWRVALPLVSRVRWILPLSIAVALIIGYASDIGYILAASSTLVYFPVFLVGWKLRLRGLHETLNKQWVRTAALVFFLFWFTIVALFYTHFDRQWFAFSSGYQPGAGILSPLIRLGALTLAVVGSLALLSLIPQRRIPWITYLGTGSMYIYLLHPFIVRELRLREYFNSIDTTMGVIIMFALAITIGLALASPPIRAIFRPIIQPRYNWPFTRDSDKTPRDNTLNNR